MPLEERKEIIDSLKEVDATMTFDDSDGSAISLLEELKNNYPNAQIIFANGGDRTAQNIPEMSVKDVYFRFGVGGEDKKNSSRWILEEWKSPKTHRQWGYYKILHENGPGVKLKELTVEPRKHLSMQKHSNRAEFWFVSEGTATVYTVNPNTTDIDLVGVFDKHQYLHVPINQWHQLSNETDNLLKIIEIQYGEKCIEEDIERRDT